jgi:hypothetical protein
VCVCVCGYGCLGGAVGGRPFHGRLERKGRRGERRLK